MKIKNIIIVFLFLLFGCTSENFNNAHSFNIETKDDFTKKELEYDSVLLSKCIDGDTARFIVNGEEQKVRFLAIDTPETVHPNKPVQPYGKKASKFTCSLLTDAKNIRLEYENDKYDKYHRLLAWVFVDGVLLQKLIIEKGYGKTAYLYGDYKYTEVLLEEESKAINNRVGIFK